MLGATIGGEVLGAAVGDGVPGGGAVVGGTVGDGAGGPMVGAVVGCTGGSMVGGAGWLGGFGATVSGAGTAGPGPGTTGRTAGTCDEPCAGSGDNRPNMIPVDAAELGAGNTATGTRRGAGGTGSISGSAGSCTTTVGGRPTTVTGAGSCTIFGLWAAYTATPVIAATANPQPVSSRHGCAPSSSAAHRRHVFPRTQPLYAHSRDAGKTALVAA